MNTEGEYCLRVSASECEAPYGSCSGIRWCWGLLRVKHRINFQFFEDGENTLTEVREIWKAIDKAWLKKCGLSAITHLSVFL